VDLSWLDPDDLERRDLAGAVAVLEAARVTDHLWLPGPTVSSFTARLRHGWDGNPPVAAVARDRDGRVRAVLTVSLPRWDNHHLAMVRVVVDPRDRRQGLGRQVFEAGLARARAEGRELASAWCLERTAGMDFLKAMGFDPALEEVLRRLDVTAVDWSRLDREYAAARPLASGYELVRMPGPVPEQDLPAVVELTAAINDAPIGDLQIEDEVFSPERIRAYEAACQAGGHRLHRLVARQRDTGVLAGHTVVAVSAERPWYADQHDTSVVRAHRGHRLGLLLKIDMLRWLREVEPQVRTVDTGNAASNTHMIGVNQRLGYEVLARIVEWQRRL
jgi:GNAT superfamily N-acetyltransferase